MEIKLPPMPDGSRKTISGEHQITIIGANGSGKTRFTEALIRQYPDRAFRMSALQAIYGQAVTAEKAMPGTIEDIYFKAVNSSPMLRRDMNNQLDRLFGILVYQEVMNLFASKVERATGSEPKEVESRLDKLFDVWKEIFPDNHVLLEGGKLVFKRDCAPDIYPSMRLSDGEKAVLYYIGAALLAMDNAMIFVENPGLFIHSSINQLLWNKIESLRPDCTFIYTTHDVMFASSRTDNIMLWVRGYNAATTTWEYDLLPANSGISDEIFLSIVGARKPVLFIEGDALHSIDAKIYSLVFPGYTVKPLGSCNKVIETVRTFNDMKNFHHLDSYGIVDRDRREEKEVTYLYEKKIFVPNVAEVENILMLEQVVRTVASHFGKDANNVFAKVKKSIITLFETERKQQALLHTRHRVKRTVEYRIDGKFKSINNLETHMVNLVEEINPRGLYEFLCREFHKHVVDGDYRSILRVFNHKTMIQESNVAGLCGLRNRDAYINAIISILKKGGRDGEKLRRAIVSVFNIDDTPNQIKLQTQ